MTTNNNTANIDSIANVLLSHGEMFHGGRATEIACDWDRYEFTAAGVHDWCSVGVWDAATANEFVEAGMTPAYVKYMAKRMVEADAYTDGCPIYAACNGDIAPKRIVDAYRNS